MRLARRRSHADLMRRQARHEERIDGVPHRRITREDLILGLPKNEAAAPVSPPLIPHRE